MLLNAVEKALMNNPARAALQRWFEAPRLLAMGGAVKGARAQLTFSNEAQKALHEAMDRQSAGKLVLGWYHTHPGYGVFLSGYDLFIHRNFYARDYHTAIVIDPYAEAPTRDVGVFVWENEEVSRPYGLIVYREGEA